MLGKNLLLRAHTHICLPPIPAKYKLWLFTSPHHNDGHFASNIHHSVIAFPDRNMGKNLTEEGTLVVRFTWWTIENGKEAQGTGMI